MLTDFLLPLKTLCSRLETTLRDRFIVAFLIFCALLLSLLYPLILKLIIYFFPLLSSTAVCFTAFYLFVMSERQATKEILLVDGEKSEHGVVQVYDVEMNRSIYNDQTEACCFLLRSKHGHLDNGLEEDNERVTFTGKLLVGITDLGIFGEEVASCVVDRLAEGAWNRYFGQSSKWHYMGNLSKET